MSDKEAVRAELENTDLMLWREQKGDYEESLFVTKSGRIGINCGGTVYVRPLREWHALAGRASAQEEGRVAGVSSEVTEAEALAFIESCRPAQGELEELQAATARVAELENNERAYERIIGPKSYQEVADEIAELTKERDDLKHDVERHLNIATELQSRLDAIDAQPVIGHVADDGYFVSESRQRVWRHRDMIYKPAKEGGEV